MRHEELVRTDFPSGTEGFDRDSVGAHLAAVAAHVSALEARIAALEVERETLRSQLAEARRAGTDRAGSEDERARRDAGPERTFTTTHPPVVPPSPHHVFPAEDQIAARLAVSKLALEGADRESIRLRLEADYDLEDTDALLDDVLERLA